MATSSTMREEYEDCISQQISEYELLKSMYPNPGELILNDKSVINEMNNFLNNKTESIPGHLDFKLNLLIEELKLKLEVFVNLHSLYPKKEPEIYVRCNNMNRQNESNLNSELMNYIKENSFGEVCLYTAISWLQENVHKYNIITENTSSKASEVNETEDEYARLWIYSHHIYNKRKRDEIVKKARELKLTGFSLPGKPGIICVEGFHNDCIEWWKHIKAMCWKKIMIRKSEIFDVSEKNTYKKFSSFEELMFTNTLINKCSPMSELSKLLHDRGLGPIFNELFGLGNDD
ncbi:RWD domain-containing protein 2B [Trichoplusia ni]|uniref:RWD domain-containing protein 2B n=1 Tax=Trichoplusia ni TaxID=7111 RepID=A0A7E5X1R0_TRINI|nr:RWD domain-containing protein 2B [Trichoplusia ni]